MNTRISWSLTCLSLAALTLPMDLRAQGGQTDISQTPLFVSSSTAVDPNMMFVLDDSGSMGFDFMPDHINATGNPPRMCRSSGASLTDSGSFDSSCCRNGNSSQACLTGSAPDFNRRRGHPPFLSASFNTVAYNPALRYKPPLTSTGTEWPSMNSGNTGGWTAVPNDAYGIQSTGSTNLLTQFPDMQWCTDSSYTDCLRNGNYVLPGTVNGKSYTTYLESSASGSGFKAEGSPADPTVAAQAWGPHYYLINPAEFCDGINLRNCQATKTGVYQFPAPVRWCDSDENARALVPSSGACQAVRNGTYAHVRFPGKFFSAGAAGTPGSPEVRATSSVKISGMKTWNNKSCALSITAFRVNGVNILSSATSSESSTTNLAASLKSRINSGSSGYSALLANQTVSITAPAGVANPGPISITTTPNTCTLTTSPATPSFGGYQAAVADIPTTPAGFPGSFERVDIVPGRASYPKAATRLDCAGATCTYAEEMTNFANWWAYYRTRMQMMKSSTSIAFAPVSAKYRVGYLSINNSQGDAFLNPASFNVANKATWFSRLIAAKPSGSTPLRKALNTVGRLYAGKQTGTLNGQAVVDPMQYSCQRNFTILSTDGFWNEDITLTQLDGTTALGDQDGTLPRPKLDGTATPDTLADVAAYYQQTDLRTGTSGEKECTSGTDTEADVCGNGDPNYAVQRMITYTLGLGASGYMQFEPKYLTATSGDYFSVAQGSSPNVASGICTWQASGDCTWPTPVNNTLTTIDDLWHAAVNGGGQYFSASNPGALEEGLIKMLDEINRKDGAGAAATASNPNITAGEDKLFFSSFKSGDWSGELTARTFEKDSTVVNPEEGPGWTAQKTLDTRISKRTIYMFGAAAANKRKEFTWGSLSATEKSYFQLAHITAAGRDLSQFCSVGVRCLSGEHQASAAGEQLLLFLRGDRTQEGPADNPEKFFRERSHVLGDIVNSEARFVGKPQLHLSDEGYGDFTEQEGIKDRRGMVYVGANDGMLHAFDAATGEEAWAYIPTPVLPNLYKLADKAYGNKHQYFVDGSPVVEDVYINEKWRTILVAGLGAGGRAYFAIDVTNPADPQPLWEFTHDVNNKAGSFNENLGYAIGKAEIAKLSNGTWVVIVPSGYNNVNPGDGNGRLFVLDAATGKPISAIPNGIETKVNNAPVGTSTTPSGLGQIRAWADNSDISNVALRVYGGDNLGNVWRFDINDSIAPAGYEAQRLAELKTKAVGGAVQPITARPELGEVDGHVMVYVGTGRYLGQTDIQDSTQQSIYAIKDRLAASDYGNPRNAANKFVKQTLVDSKCPLDSPYCVAGSATRSNNSPVAVDLAVNNGWYVDLPQSRERVNQDPLLVQGILTVTSNVIDPSGICNPNGSSWLNYFDYRTGAPPASTSGISSVFLGAGIATRPETYQIGDGTLKTSVVKDDGTLLQLTQPSPGRNRPANRLSWRELPVQ